MKKRFLDACERHKVIFLAVTLLVTATFCGACYAKTEPGQTFMRLLGESKPAAAAYSTTAASSDETKATTAATTAATTIQTEPSQTAAATETSAQTEATTAATTAAATTAAPKTTPAPKTKQAVQTTAAPAQTAAQTAAPTTAATTAAAPASLGDTSGSYNGDMAYAVLNLVNQQRAAAGLAALTWNGTLADSAKIRAQEVVVSWSHTRPDGSPWYTAGAGLQYGENLAAGQSSAEQAVSEWMASEGHKANIMNSGFTQMGVACYYCGGMYYWVQHFA